MDEYASAMPDAPRVVVDPGSHAVLNLGDVAMLQVAVSRMKDIWPSASIEVLTTDPDRLARHCPGVRPLASAGRYVWMEDGRHPGPVRRALLRGARAARAAGPRAAGLSFRAERRIRGIDGHGRSYLEALRGADLLLISGRGCLCDAFRGESLQLLGELEAATLLGVPTAMMGQGVGPLTDPEVSARAAEVLREVDLVALREAATGPALLESLGVSPSHLAVTGDDALELVAASTPAQGEGIGLNLRAADYAGVGDAAIATVGAAVRAVADRLGAPLVAVPISLNPTQADTDTFTRLTGEPAASPATTAEAIGAVASCRVVVTGAYHAAVFALAQGVPAVGIAASDYYRGKLHGAGRQFGYDLPVLDPGEPGFAGRLDESMRAAWAIAPERREALVRSAARQVASGRAAYERLAELVPGAQRRSSTSRSCAPSTLPGAN